MSRLRVALAASVLLNIFLAGALVGGAFWVRVRSPMIAAGSLRIAGAELPVGERRAFRRAMREVRASAGAQGDSSRAARIEAADLLRRPMVDEAAVDAALARARAADLAVRGAVEARAVRFAAALPLADRARLAEAMRRRAEKSRP